MNRKEFIERCSSAGYCSKKEARKYAGKRTEFSEQDFIAVYRKYEEKYPTVYDYVSPADCDVNIYGQDICPPWERY